MSSLRQRARAGVMPANRVIVGDCLQELAGLLHTFYNRHRVIGDDLAVTTARLVLLKCASADLCGFREEPVLDVSHMSFGEIFILADKHYRRNPEFFCLMLFKALADNLGLADICAR